MMTRTPRDGTLNLRLTRDAMQTLQAAARTVNRSVSEFVLESALAQAAEILPDRRHFILTSDQWTDFMAALDAPARDLPRMRRLFSEPSVFDQPVAPETQRDSLTGSE